MEEIISERFCLCQHNIHTVVYVWSSSPKATPVVKQATSENEQLYNPCPYPQSNESLATVDIDASKGFVDLWVHSSFAIFDIFDLKDS